MTEIESARRAKTNLDIVEALGQLSPNPAPEARLCECALWEAVAELALGCPWHGISPEAALSAARTFLAGQVAA